MIARFRPTQQHDAPAEALDHQDLSVFDAERVVRQVVAEVVDADANRHRANLPRTRLRVKGIMYVWCLLGVATMWQFRLVAEPRSAERDLNPMLVQVVGQYAAERPRPEVGRKPDRPSGVVEPDANRQRPTVQDGVRVLEPEEAPTGKPRAMSVQRLTTNASRSTPSSR